MSSEEREQLGADVLDDGLVLLRGATADPAEAEGDQPRTVGEQRGDEPIGGQNVTSEH